VGHYADAVFSEPGRCWRMTATPMDEVVNEEGEGA
jgi:hypothetical protein